jgi:hypothetical protein
MNKVLTGFLLLMITASAQAQANKKPSTKKSTSAKPIVKKAIVAKPLANTKTFTYKSAASYTAKRPVFASNVPATFTIADPTINAFRLKNSTNGNYDLTNRQIIALPKGSYGIANGRITLTPLGARTSGSFTGSGSVGTGTSAGIVGTAGPAMNVNGRNPYAGNNLYGLQAPKEKLSTSSNNTSNTTKQ